ncbi:MAG: DNA methyltransferase [Rhodospirillaceae bacterium]|nr:DNA methyltransferase [Magnetovibrio sp.]MAY66897.1 DNA methyltransferase [Rhodospirillaceae bacterium]
MEQAVEEYFARLQALKSTGAATSETTYYSALEGLLNFIGKDLKPKVFCVSQLANQGAGHPDFGMYTANQCQKGEPKPGQKPERGVIEVKGTSDDTWLTADTGQISKYWGAYRLVLVTNYRDFLLVGENAAGHATKLESFRLANTESEFWSRTLTARKYAQEVGQSFGEYLKRALTQSVSLREPRDVAWFLASYARDALGRVEEKGDVPALKSVRTALEEALGVHFTGDKGAHFFQSTLVQTLFYGVFSAWVLWSRQVPPPTGAFDWRSAVWHLRVPMLQALFQQVSDPTKLKALDLVELLDWAGAALNRIDRKEFFSRFKDAEAVQYFYEPFLEAFDPALRKELGVWYTPPEVVTYMVARVDKALKDDLGIADGLAADNVYILDPCTGTGSYLAETLRKISSNLEDKGLGALKGPMVKKAATERVFGFEIMPAPFVVAHLQIGLVLQSLQAPLTDDGTERAGVYLTNALTGWEPTEKEKQHVAFPEMEEERDRANEVKREKPILVILGNPPYNGFAGMAMEEERSLSDAYRTVKKVRKPEGQGLNDLYVRFFRMAERRIAEKTGQGIICFISNYSWLDGLSFTGMRERYLEVFDAIRIDSLNGDAYRTGKVAPDGTPDPSIFSTDHNREGIQVGTAITTLVRKQESTPCNEVEVRNLWGQKKHQILLDSAGVSAEKLYEGVEPSMALGLPYLAAAVSTSYFDWPSLSELLPASFPGVKTSRDEFLVDVDEQALQNRIIDYFDASIPDDVIREKYPSILNNAGRFDGPAIRMKLKARGIAPGNFVRYLYRPLDARWLYWEPDTKLLDEKRSEYFSHIFEGNFWIEAREKQTKEDFNRGTVTSVLADNFGSGLSTFFPAYLRETHSNGDNGLVEKRPNLLKSVEDKLSEIGLGVEDLFHHIVSVLHSPMYRAENAGALRMDWPRVPFPEKPAVLTASAELGRQLAALMEPEKPVSGVTIGVRAELKALGVPSKVGGGDLAANDFALAAGWGSAQKGGIVMPGRGKAISREYTPTEVAAFGAGSGPLGMTPSQIIDLLGGETLDIYLNADAYWRNVPEKVWTYKLGGYQVIKKWLSYREKDILGRPLKPEEVQEVTNMIRRIAAILLLTPSLDDNYAKAKAAVL